jgi:hypothetical protein
MRICLVRSMPSRLSVGSPDHQALWKEAAAYDALVEETAVPLTLGSLPFTTARHTLPDGTEFFDPAVGEARLLALSGH